MAQSSQTFSAASTFTVKSAGGTVYGLTLASPAAGGTVVVADLANLASNPPNMGIPSTFGPNLITAITLPASPQPLDIPLYGRRLSNGLLLSITSTQTVTVFYD
jgi:hypothetical protein